MKIQKLILALTAIAFLASCSSQSFRVGAQQGRPYEVVGKGEGAATGIMLFQFIPIGQNTKLSRAYDASLRNLQGDDLINTTITESWFWAYVLNGYKTKIEGDVIRYKDDKGHHNRSRN